MELPEEPRLGQVSLGAVGQADLRSQGQVGAHMGPEGLGGLAVDLGKAGQKALGADHVKAAVARLQVPVQAVAAFDLA